MYTYLREKLQEVASKYGERVLEVNNNKISIAVSLSHTDTTIFKPQNQDATFFGSYLFSRRVSGIRICTSTEGKRKTIVKSIDG
jgi:O-phospho-L-seryl-tRNASec:L-selenocysteinyl-tRNA synthase